MLAKNNLTTPLNFYAGATEHLDRTQYQYLFFWKTLIVNWMFNTKLKPGYTFKNIYFIHKRCQFVFNHNNFRIRKELKFSFDFRQKSVTPLPP